jgi:hypothetical protein
MCEEPTNCAGRMGIDLGQSEACVTLPELGRCFEDVHEYLQVRRVPLLESANLTVNRRVFIWTLHRLRLSPNYSSRPYISLSVQMLLASARSWAEGPSRVSVPSIMKSGN